MKKKILFLIFNLGGGGAEKVLVQLVNALDPERYDITVQTIFNVGVNNDSLNPNIHRNWLFNKQFNGMKYIVRLFSPRFLHKLLIKEHYDYEIAYLEGIPTRVVCGCRDKSTRTFAWVHIQMVNKKAFFSSYRTVNEARRCYQKFDKVAFVSEIAQSTFMEKTGWTELKTGIVHNTLDIDQIKALSIEPVNIELNPTFVNLCSVGRLTNQKGYVRLMNIFGNLVQKEIIHWHFYLLGQGELHDEIVSSIEERGLKDYVTLLGYDTNPYKYVSKMDWFVCSSYKEGYSTAVSESVIVGTPVVTTDCAGMKEILGDETGIIVENSDEALEKALEEVLSDKSLAATYKERTIIRSAFFSKERTLKEFEDFINS